MNSQTTYARRSNKIHSMKIFSGFHLLAIVLLSSLMANSVPAAQNTSGTLLFVGTYTGAKSKGIYAYRMDAEGKLTSLGLAAETRNPTFLALHPNRRFLYAANEIGNFDGTKAGAIAAFSIDAVSGKLTLLNQQSSGGDGPCHLIVDSTGKNVLAANYNGGSVCSLPINQDGSLGKSTTFIQHKGSSVNPQRQQGPHGHCIITDAANRFALACDLGLDQILIYQFDANKGLLKPNDPPFGSVAPGSGPRHIAFHPNGRIAYVISEMACTMTTFAYDAQRGALKELQSVSTLPGPVERGFSTAEVEVHPSGKFVYGSNRGHDSIVAFRVDEKTGTLTLIEHKPTQGKVPRHFEIDPSGNFLLAENQNSDTVVVFRIDQASGRLTATGYLAEVGSPVCIKFVPAAGR